MPGVGCNKRQDRKRNKNFKIGQEQTTQDKKKESNEMKTTGKDGRTDWTCLDKTGQDWT